MTASNQHTPGPWVAREHQFGGCHWVKAGDDDIQISTANHAADADLIAAAPDLLESLTTCMGRLDSLSRDLAGFLAEDTEAIIDQARAAIAKAKGTS